MAENKTLGEGVLKEVAALVVETDEDVPTIIAMISADSILPADGYRVRLRLKEMRSENFEPSKLQESK